MTNAILVNEGPFQHQAVDTVYQFCKAAIDLGHEVLPAFSYHDGVTHLAAICAICKSQFSKVLPYYGFQMDQIVSVHQLVSDAIVMAPRQ